ncbi:hypothetical protein ACGF1Z_12010 [Streptomyces sp. NPDC048018]|uniref:hypothetical protein n=1 Tax=Streptomyces sp. NPDC048018 TaxID=3365499 RepID=UPI00372260EC
MDPDTSLVAASLFPDEQPWDVVFDAFHVTHGQFWLVAGDGAEIVSAVPEGDSLKGNGAAIGIPASRSATRVSVALSFWEEPAHDGCGALVGRCRIAVPDRELALVNVEGREPGPVLLLPDGGEYEVTVRRLEAEDAVAPERYEIRVWPCAAPR